MADGLGATDGAWLRYAAWEGHYRLLDRAPTLGPRQRRVISALVLAVFVAGVWWTVHRVQTLGWSGFPVVWVWVLLWLPWTVFSARRPAGTRVIPAGLTVCTHPFRTRTVAWDDVVEVQPAGRFEEHASALLTGGERLALLGLPADVAEAMAAVTRPEPPPRPTPPARRPAPDEDLDGPFHRGTSPRWHPGM